jgi:DNA-binding transcriptional MerR regulator
VNSSRRSLNASEAAIRLGISPKALRLYERRGLVTPDRTEAGWRLYGPSEMARAGEVASLRALGLSLAQVAEVLEGEGLALDPALAAREASVARQMRDLGGVVEKIRGLRAGLAQGKMPPAGELSRLLAHERGPSVAFDLPWPWGGEHFELGAIAKLTFIVGPLGSGKTVLARRLAAEIPGAAFLGLDRLENGGAAARAMLDADPALRSRVARSLAWLAEEGAAASDALIALLAGLEADGPAALVVDMLEQGLDEAAQEAVIAHLRRRGADAPPLFVLTRSAAILDPAAMRADEAIILCPANHSPPRLVPPYPGAPGYEAVMTCLASPEVRARMQGVIAWRPRDKAGA